MAEPPGRRIDQLDDAVCRALGGVEEGEVAVWQVATVRIKGGHA